MHPNKFDGDRYQPIAWETTDGRRRYFLSRNRLGRWWPGLETKTDRDWYGIVIRDSNPFKSLSGAIRFVEKFIAKDVSNGFVFKSED
jgi:hypothetical protein